MPVMQQPEAYLSRIAGAIDADGRVTAPKTLEFLERFAIAFEQWIRRLSPPDDVAVPVAAQANSRRAAGTVMQ